MNEHFCWTSSDMEEMDSKPYQPLSKTRHEMEMAYTSSSDESEDGHIRAKSYTSRETLPDYGQELRLNYNSHSKRQTTFSETAQGEHCTGYFIWVLFLVVYFIYCLAQNGLRKRQHNLKMNITKV